MQGDCYGDNQKGRREQAPAPRRSNSIRTKQNCGGLRAARPTLLGLEQSKKHRKIPIRNPKLRKFPVAVVDFPGVFM